MGRDTETIRHQCHEEDGGGLERFDVVFLNGVEPLPGPPRRRIVGKKPPLFVTGEWDLMKKLRTEDPEFQRGALVDSLSVAGIERQQLAAAQCTCPDFRAVCMGKLAESMKRDVH